MLVSMDLFCFGKCLKTRKLFFDMQVVLCSHGNLDTSCVECDISDEIDRGVVLIKPKRS